MQSMKQIRVVNKLWIIELLRKVMLFCSQAPSYLCVLDVLCYS